MKYEETTKNRIVGTSERIFCVYMNEETGEPGVTQILPQIEDIKEIENDETFIIIVYFTDGTSEKAVLSYEDEYSFEQGVSICLTKRLLSNYVRGQGSSIYNKLIKHAIRVFDHNRNIEEEELHRQFEEHERQQRQERRIREKKERRRRRAEERQIEIQKEAYKRALYEYGLPHPNNSSYGISPEAEADISPELPEETNLTF